MFDVGDSSTAVYGGEGGRGGGGKLRRERNPPPTPYDRPQRGRWVSRIVDPAKRLFYGLPSLFSPYSSSNVADEVPLEDEQEAQDPEENFPVDLALPTSAGEIVSSDAKGKSKLDISDEDRLDKREGYSDGGVPDIEQLIKGKTFSRKDIDHLMKILNSKVVDAEQERKTSFSITGLDLVDRAETSYERQKISVNKEEELNKYQWATSTPLPRPAIHDGIGASPVDLAKAYMGSRTSEMGITSTSLMPTTEKFGFTSEFPSNPAIPSPLPKAPICWPGAVTQNQLNYSTPQSLNHRSGLHRFSRTPYSRTIFSKSKSKLTPQRGDSERFPNISSTPFQPTATPAYVKSVESSYGSGGPLRRMRSKFASATPARKSTTFSTVERNSWTREPNVDFTHKKNFEPGSSSKSNFDSTNNKKESHEAVVLNVHPHSSRLARQILEQLDRPITLKERSEELKLAASWKESSVAPVHNINSPCTAAAAFGKSKNFDGVKLSARINVESNALPQERINTITAAGKDTFGAVASQDKTSIFGVNNGPSTDIENHNSERGPEQGADNNLPNSSQVFGNLFKGSAIINNSAESAPQNAQRKPILPSIAVEKSGMRTSFASINSPSFTFPFSTPSTLAVEPPTPSVMPSLSTSDPQQLKISANLPAFTSGSKITFAPPASAPKFKFGSGKPRLSFALSADDAASAPNDAVIPKYKFGSDKNRLSFGLLESDALCC